MDTAFKHCFGGWKKIEYVKVKTFNQYTHQPITVILAKDLFAKFFLEKNADLTLADYVAGDKNIPFEIIGSFKGSDLEGVCYEQLYLTHNLKMVMLSVY